MAVKPTKPIFPNGLESEDQVVTHGGILNDGVIEHGADAVLTLPETTDDKGTPSAVRYNAATDEYEGYFAIGGWSSLGGGDGRWEVLPYAASSNLLEGRSYLVDNTQGVSTVMLPIPVKIGDSVTVSDAYGKFAEYPLTINPQDKPLYGVVSPMTISTANVAVTFTWAGEDRGWIITGGVGLGQGRIYSREIFTKVLDSETVVVTLGNEPDIVDVYADGKRLPESKYSKDGATVTFDPALPSGTELQIVEYTPVQLSIGGGSGNDIDDGANPAWLYIATGGETRIVPGTTLGSVSCIYVNGDRQFPGRGFEFSQTGGYIDVADVLEPGDEVIIVSDETGATINSVLISDPIVIARVLGIKTEQVKILAQNQDITGSYVVYDQISQTAWYTRAATGVVLSWDSTNGMQVVTDQGTYTLQRFGVMTSLGDYESGPFTVVDKNQEIRYQGIKYYVSSEANLPFTTTGNDVSSWVDDKYNFFPVGDNTVRSDLTTLGEGQAADMLPLPQGGTVLSAMNYITPEMFGASGDGETDDTSHLQAALTAWLSYPDKQFVGNGNYLLSSGVTVISPRQGSRGYINKLTKSESWKDSNTSLFKREGALVYLDVGVTGGNAMWGSLFDVGTVTGDLNKTLPSDYHIHAIRNLGWQQCEINVGYGTGFISVINIANTKSTTPTNKYHIRVALDNLINYYAPQNIPNMYEGCTFSTTWAGACHFAAEMLGNGSTYTKILGGSADFSGEYLSYLTLSSMPSSVNTGDEVTNSAGTLVGWVIGFRHHSENYTTSLIVAQTANIATDTGTPTASSISTGDIINFGGVSYNVKVVTCSNNSHTPTRFLPTAICIADTSQTIIRWRIDRDYDSGSIFPNDVYSADSMVNIANEVTPHTTPLPLESKFEGNISEGALILLGQRYATRLQVKNLEILSQGGINTAKHGSVWAYDGTNTSAVGSGAASVVAFTAASLGAGQINGRINGRSGEPVTDAIGMWELVGWGVNVDGSAAIDKWDVVWGGDNVFRLAKTVNGTNMTITSGFDASGIFALILNGGITNIQAENGAAWQYRIAALRKFML